MTRFVAPLQSQDRLSGGAYVRTTWEKSLLGKATTPATAVLPGTVLEGMAREIFAQVRAGVLTERFGLATINLPAVAPGDTVFVLDFKLGQAADLKPAAELAAALDGLQLGVTLRTIEHATQLSVYGAAGETGRAAVLARETQAQDTEGPIDRLFAGAKTLLWVIGAVLLMGAAAFLLHQLIAAKKAVTS